MAVRRRKPPNDSNGETFAAIAMGCGSNAPLRAREGPGALILPSHTLSDAGIANDATTPGLLSLVPPPALPPLQGPTTTAKKGQPGIKRHLHTRYVRAMDEACHAPLDSNRCLFDHES